MKYLMINLLLILVSLSGCAGITPEKFKDHHFITTPNESAFEAPYPVIFLFTGSGGGMSLPYRWSTDFNAMGIATVIIDSAGVRNMNKLYTVNYGKDIAPVLAAVKSDPRLDLKRYGMMGFSKGGTAALESGRFLPEDAAKPAFIFALYPGAYEYCPNTHGSETDVIVFYGDDDDWGNWKGKHRRTALQSCTKMAKNNENARLYLFEGAKHGYDGGASGSFSCCGGGTFKYGPDYEAKEKTRAIIRETVGSKWNLED